jgi:demethylmenaquinone methyltransferase/2-methoxy-6-polyprenyl-1,4-benzoquinol methylase
MGAVMTGGSLLSTKVPPQIAAYKNAARVYNYVIEPLLWGMRRAVSECAQAMPGMTALDVCGGTGAQAFLFSQSGALAVAADMSPHMLCKARGRAHENLKFVLASADRLPFESGIFDLVSMSLALHEIPEKLRLSFTGEMQRVARPGGRIVIMDYALPLKASLAALPCRSACWLAERAAGGAHYRNYRDWMARDALRGFAARAGLNGQFHVYYGGAMNVLVAQPGGS